MERYPDDSRAGTALFFLGRMAEANEKYGEAKAYYERLSTQYPHYFYAVLGRERTTGNVAAATADEDAAMWLADVSWPARRDFSATTPNAATAQRIERARLLSEAGLADFAEAELRFGAKTETEQPQLLALELAAGGGFAFPCHARHEEPERRLSFLTSRQSFPGVLADTVSAAVEG